MNLIQKFILQRAEKIQKAEKERLDTENADRTEKQKRWNESKSVVEKFIDDKFKEIAKDMNKIEPHVSVGDEVILNIYNVGCDSYNGWDGGPTSYIRNCNDKSPVILRLTQISVEYSLASERLGKWLESKPMEFFDSPSEFIFNKYKSFYESYYKCKDGIGYGRLGLYLSANFEPISHTFAPKWTLHLGSFLKLNSEEGQHTLSIWKEENEISNKLKAIEVEKAKILERKEEIDEIYKGIKIIR